MTLYYTIPIPQTIVFLVALYLSIITVIEFIDDIISKAQIPSIPTKTNVIFSVLSWSMFYYLTQL